jgi:hypothetical protein
MKTGFDLRPGRHIRGCPVCGQGGVHKVRLLQAGGKIAQLCEECDALWLEEEISDPDQFTRFEEYMDSIGKPASWGDVEILD